jgi:hypothetical protein
MRVRRNYSPDNPQPKPPWCNPLSKPEQSSHPLCAHKRTLPAFLYTLALQGEREEEEEEEEGRFFAKKVTCRSLSIRSCQIGKSRDNPAARNTIIIAQITLKRIPS